MQIRIGATTAIILLEFVWMPLMLPFGIWSLTYFRFNVIFSWICVLVAAVIATLLPLWEGVSRTVLAMPAMTSQR